MTRHTHIHTQMKVYIYIYICVCTLTMRKYFQKFEINEAGRRGGQVLTIWTVHSAEISAVTTTAAYVRIERRRPFSSMQRQQWRQLPNTEASILLVTAKWTSAFLNDAP